MPDAAWTNPGGYARTSYMKIESTLMNRIGGILLAVFVAAGSTAASAQNGPPPPGAMPQQQAAGEIRGIVRDGANGQALAARPASPCAARATRRW